MSDRHVNGYQSEKKDEEHHLPAGFDRSVNQNEEQKQRNDDDQDEDEFFPSRSIDVICVSSSSSSSTSTLFRLIGRRTR